MKRENRTCWTSDDGQTLLLEKRGPDLYFVPLWGNVNLETLRELAEAANNAVALERMNTPRNGFAAEVTEAVAEEAALRG